MCLPLALTVGKKRNCLPLALTVGKKRKCLPLALTVGKKRNFLPWALTVGKKRKEGGPYQYLIRIYFCSKPIDREQGLFILLLRDKKMFLNNSSQTLGSLFCGNII
jgi:hypothetical protein